MPLGAGRYREGQDLQGGGQGRAHHGGKTDRHGGLGLKVDGGRDGPLAGARMPVHRVRRGIAAPGIERRIDVNGSSQCTVSKTGGRSSQHETS